MEVFADEVVNAGETHEGRGAQAILCAEVAFVRVRVPSEVHDSQQRVVQDVGQVRRSSGARRAWTELTH